MKRDPERTCLACRRKRPRSELLRIARSLGGRVSVGEVEGRGAYVCPDDPSCRAAVTRRGALSRALRVALTPGDLARLATEIEKEKVEA